MSTDETHPTAPSVQKRCFVVSAFGADEQTKLERAQTHKHLFKKVLVPMGYDVRRADELNDPGQITHQIIERLLDDELVVADLTGLNPNVFYELAVRHAARRPVITVMTEGETIPFDVKDVRTVFYDLHDPDRLEQAQQELRQTVEVIEQDPDNVRNPITVVRKAALFQDSDNPDVQATGELLSSINDLRDEVRALSSQVNASRYEGRSMGAIERIIRQLVKANRFGTRTTTELAAELGEDPRRVLRVLQNIVSDPGSGLYNVEGQWSEIPF